MSKAALSWLDCPEHGRQLGKYDCCVSCHPPQPPRPRSVMDPEPDRYAYLARVRKRAWRERERKKLYSAGRVTA